MNNRTKGIVIALIVVAVILVSSAVALSGILGNQGGGTTTTPITSTTTSQSSTSSSTSQSSSSGTGALTKTQSGMVASDPLISGTTTNWNFSGYSGAGSKSENSSGLYLGVSPQNQQQWAGYFGEMSLGDAHVYHAVISMPSSTIASGSFNAGLYVSTLVTYPQNPSSVNYISCGSGVNTAGYYWQVVYGQGNLSGASSFKVLAFYYNTLPLTEPCTIVTNGANMLTVYIGSNMVYTNSSMNLQINSPFNAYLQVTQVNSTQTYYARFTDFYAALNNTITISNAPSGGVVKLVNSSGNTIANATVGSNGVAMIALTPYQDPPSGYIKVFSSSSSLVASTSSAATLWGGDEYSVR